MRARWIRQLLVASTFVALLFVPQLWVHREDDEKPGIPAPPQSDSGTSLEATMNHSFEGLSGMDDDWLAGGLQSYAASCPANVSGTIGDFSDSFASGNTPFEVLAAALHHTNVSTHSPVHLPLDEFRTTVYRVGNAKASKDCYYIITNFCIDRGSLVFFAPTGFHLGEVAPSSSFGSLRLCNDLRSKVTLRFAVNRSVAGPTLPLSSRPAHVTACWQLYGFHLVECLAAIAAGEERILPTVCHTLKEGPVVFIYNHAASLPKAAREHYSHATFLGSSGSFTATQHEEAARLGYRPATYWGLWRGVTSLAADVHEVRKFPFDGASPGQCFRHGLIGQPHPAVVSEAERQRFVLRLRRAWQVPASPLKRRSPRCTAFSIAVAQRSSKTSRVQGSREINNIAGVLSALQHTVGAESNVSVLDWASLPLVEQMKSASRIDVLVTMHGAGNTWVVMMPPRSVIVELWPDCISRNVYAGLAAKHNIRYFPLCHRRQGADFLHASLTVDTNELQNLMTSKVLPYLRQAHCCP